MGIILNESDIERFIRINSTGNTITERVDAMSKFISERYENGKGRFISDLEFDDFIPEELLDDAFDFIVESEKWIRKKNGFELKKKYL